MLLETVRGCRFRCSYCYYPKSHDALAFSRPQQIVGLICAMPRSRLVSEVVLLDPTLNQRPDFADFLRGLARGNPQRQLAFSGELRAEGIDAAPRPAVREANFHEVEIGLQSVEPRAWQLMGRPTNLAAFERGVNALLAEGIKVQVGPDPRPARRHGRFDPPRPRLPAPHRSRIPRASVPSLDPAGHGFSARGPSWACNSALAALLRAENAHARRGADARLMEEAAGGFWHRVRPFAAAATRAAAGVVLPGGTVAGCCLNLDLAKEEAATGRARTAKRSQAFALLAPRGRLQGSPAGRGREQIRQVLADNPHTTLQVVSSQPAIRVA